VGLVQCTPPAASARFHGFLLTIETVAWVVGLVCLVYVGALYIDGTWGSREAVQRFEDLQAAQKRAVAPDLSLWSAQRIAAWQSRLAMPPEAPVAVLRIPRIHLDVAVLEGTSELTLNRGVGHIEETAMPGTNGNSGIAGHRDGFFRGLKDIGVSDAIELETLQGKQIYKVERTWIVNPEDVSVLDPTPAQSITLVTCYPFYFVGSAPQRYIVRAVRADPGPTTSLELVTSKLLR
jgi:sortase A